jgi:hypothetical protein
VANYGQVVEPPHVVLYRVDDAVHADGPVKTDDRHSRDLAVAARG